MNKILKKGGFLKKRMHITLTELVNQYYEIFNDAYIHIFAGVIVLDILTGMIKAWVNKTLNSTIGRRGLIEHLIVLVLGVTVYPYLNFIGFEEVAATFIFFFIATYGLSLIENLSEIGVPFPKGLKKRLEKIKDHFDEE